MIAKITSENENLASQNFKLKSSQNLNDSIAMMPDACFIDIQTAKKQREAVHSATKQVIEELAEEHAKGKQDALLNNISQLEQKNKQLYLEMYENLGSDLNRYTNELNYKQMVEASERKKQDKLKQDKEIVKEEFRYKLDMNDEKTYEDFVQDQIHKKDKLSKSNKNDSYQIDDLLTKYNI